VWQTKQGIRFKFHDKLQALEKLGKHLGMFKDAVEHTGAMRIVYDAKAFGVVPNGD
jgi:hypothetical protein